MRDIIQYRSYLIYLTYKISDILYKISYNKLPYFLYKISDILNNISYIKSKKIYNIPVINQISYTIYQISYKDIQHLRYFIRYLFDTSDI